jgi:hypothetical protein
MFSMTTVLDLILGVMLYGPGAFQKQTPKQSFFTSLYFLALVTCVVVFIFYLGLDWKPARMEILELNSQFCVFQKSGTGQEKSNPDTKPFRVLISCDNGPYAEKLIRLGFAKMPELQSGTRIRLTDAAHGYEDVLSLPSNFSKRDFRTGDAMNVEYRITATTPWLQMPGARRLINAMFFMLWLGILAVVLQSYRQLRRSQNGKPV